jgi:hypothetical protein
MGSLGVLLAGLSSLQADRTGFAIPKVMERSKRI